MNSVEAELSRPLIVHECARYGELQIHKDSTGTNSRAESKSWGNML